MPCSRSRIGSAEPTRPATTYVVPTGLAEVIARMSSSRPPRSVSRVLLAAVLACSFPGIATAEEGIEGGAVDIFPRPLGSSNLLEPIGNLLSGRASLIARGMDPGFGDGEVAKPGDPDGFDPATGSVAGHPGSLGGAGALPAARPGVQHQRAHHARLQQLARTRPSPTSPSTPMIQTTSSWAPSTTTSPRPPPTSASMAASRGAARSMRPTCSTTWARAATRCWPSIARAPRT